MKQLTIIILTILTCLITSCVRENTFSGSKITYEEALTLESVSFMVDNQKVESTNIRETSTVPSGCHDFPDNCEDDYTIYYKSFEIKIDPDTDHELRFVMTPALKIPVVLLQNHNSNVFFYKGPEFSYLKNIERLYLREGSWFNDERRVKFQFTMEDPVAGFYSQYVLSENDQFEITEIQKISDRENTFLVSGIFNVLIPDGRTWLPVNELQDPKNLSDGTFSIIVEPLEVK